jgi:hypothetical protein
MGFTRSPVATVTRNASLHRGEFSAAPHARAAAIT